MKVIVLGAGVVGVTSAWMLCEAGHEVTVLERNCGAACETSFANGGQISVSHAEPWANPGAPLKLLKWLGREDAPLLFRLRADRAQWRWGLQFLVECLPQRSRANTRALVNLGTYSRDHLQALRAATGLHYDQRTRGILHYYTSAREFEAALEPARLMRELGCERRVIDPREVVRIEPALAAIQSQLAGATYTAADESGDAHQFTVRLAALAAARGVAFQYGTRVTALRAEAGRVSAVEVVDASGAYRRLTADAFVVALATGSRDLVKPLGIDLNIYPAKGYSATLPVIDSVRAPTVSLTDDEHKLVFSRLGDRLRVAGTAELNGYNLALNPTRCDAILRRTLAVFPGAVDATQVQYWTGLRPATPSNLPYVGRSRYPNLYLNTGHGTLGWTLACGSAHAIADLVAGRRPEVKFPFLGIEPSAVPVALHPVNAANLG